MRLLFIKQIKKTKNPDFFPSNIKCISLAAFALIMLWTTMLFFATSIPVLAAEKSNTMVLPLKINTQDDRKSLTETVDAAMAMALDASLARQKIFKVLPRTEAEKNLDYDAAWPPAFETIEEFSSKVAPGFDYIAAGSLTKLGDSVSIDIKVFDLINPASPKFYYLEGEELKNIERSMEKITYDILSYTGRSFLITSIAPEGNKRIDSGAILRSITSRSGDLYEPEKLRNDIKSIFKMGYFDDVRLKVEDTEKGKKIIFEVKEKPVIGVVTINGQDELKEDDIREVISVMPNTILNPNRVREAVDNILSLYKSKGYYNTEVTTDLTYPKPERVNVSFVIEEGKKVYIKKIRFAGNEAFKDSKLEKVMGTKEKNILSWFTDSGVLKREILEQDASRITGFYHHHGYIEAMVGKPEVTQEGKWLYITIEISEGDRYRVGNIDLSGDLIGEKEELLSLLKIKDEEYLSRNILRQDILRLNDYYAENGYAFAEATPTVNTDKEDKLVDINIHINKGDLVYINRIIIQGNTRTRDKVIRRKLLISEQGIFDSKALRQSHQQLQRLDFFEDVSITPEPTTDKTKMDLIVEVREKPTGAFSVGAGYSSVDSVMFMGEISQNNFLGRGQRVALQGNVGGSSTKFNLGLTEPHFYDTQLLVGVDLYNWRRNYDAYDRDSTGFTLRFGYPVWGQWYMNTSYGFDDTSLKDIDYLKVDESTLDTLDIHTTSFVSLGLNRDTRNGTFVITKGSINTIRAEYAGGILQGDSQYTKLEGSTGWYYPGFFFDETAFHFKLSAGKAWENESGKLPDFEKFYLGGINSLRGFPARSIGVDASEIFYDDNKVSGGQNMWYSNVEYLFPIVKQGGLRGVIFYDIGNVYDDEWDFNDIKQDVGAGLRWLSPMGPMRLEWAKVINPKDYEDSSNWEFSMGGAF
jgi:outer membrane protein insertion porin family